MVSIKCTLFCHSLSAHVQQLYTGFNILSEERILKVKQKIDREPSIANSNNQFEKSERHAHLSVEVSLGKERIQIFYDTHDRKEIAEDCLQSHDLYFKRSYSKQYIKKYHSKRGNDIYPLGLNYLVLPNKFNTLTLHRNVSLANAVRRKIGGTVQALGIKNKIKFYPRLKNLNSSPLEYLEDKVLFMVTAYDPYENLGLPKEKIEERAYNNEFRAKCIRSLRKELGSKFYGGFIHNKYTTKTYPDLLIDKKECGKKGNYIKKLTQFPICIATTGLHGSIGWKFAEYVSFSKAIVSEKLRYEVPGDFGPGKNYLEFTSPEGCVENSLRLLDDHSLRREIMINNFLYYQHYVRPDILIFNSIIIAIKRMLHW